MIRLLFFGLVASMFWACEKAPISPERSKPQPKIEEGGKLIRFAEAGDLQAFALGLPDSSAALAEFVAPAQVVLLSQGKGLMIFKDPALSAHYTALLQHRATLLQKEAIVAQKQNIILQKEALIQQRQLEVQRTEDLLRNGVATGRELSEMKAELLLAQTEYNAAKAEYAAAQADLLGEQSLLLEHQIQLKTAGFEPEELGNVPSNRAWLLAELPESLMGSIHQNSNCQIQFTAFPNQAWTGRLEGLAAALDVQTRMVRLRISLDNSQGKLKTGMFAKVSFQGKAAHGLSIPKSGLVTVQAQHYVFVRKEPNVLERRAVVLGADLGERVLVLSGLNAQEVIAQKGILQLKGLSFGY
jgi:multidrug efflux pump subunit AcrA (membrane-fusion protein)